jgi:hypothetical protein
MAIVSLAILFSCLVTSSILEVIVPIECWYPDGSFSFDTPCWNASKQNATCCPSESVCSDVGQCTLNHTEYTAERASCTDKIWSDPICPEFCTSVNITAMNFYGYGSDGDMIWCCGRKGPCDQDLVVLGVAGGVTIIDTINSPTATSSRGKILILATKSFC